MQTLFKNSFNTLNLQRYPITKNQLLQAWDASDAYLLEHMSNEQAALAKGKILIFNDAFGALTLALHAYKPTILTDSYICQQSIISNCQDNALDVENINIINSLSPLKKNYDYVFIKVPKTLDFLRYFLANLKPHIHENTQIVVAIMIKTTAKTVWNILAQMLGETSTSLAKKKARLIFVKPAEHSHDKEFSGFPTSFVPDNSTHRIFNHANVFSKNKLDIGSRFLLQHLPKLENIKHIIDLGCGNGIIGLNLAVLYPHAQILFTDESHMAIASARLTIKHNLPANSNCKFLVTDCLTGVDHDSADLIVCNPPFHQSHAIGIHIALRMFQQSHTCLKKGGTFVVVANRHLPYYSKLKQLFKSIKTIASNNKFSIYCITK
ncbi:MAG TPA: methyltransferase domain-containing protein [Oceanospirillales bacterium]|nr:methyltransferase domain-containing protein [Oceanospirillales bacterium]